MISAMNNARLIQVIVTDLLRRGSGKTPEDPVRVVTQFWTPDGELLAEVDAYQQDAMREAWDLLLDAPVGLEGPTGEDWERRASDWRRRYRPNP